MQRKESPCAPLVGMQAGAATLENSMEVSQKIENRAALCPSNFTTQYLPKKDENPNLKGYMPVNIPSIFIV